MTDFSQIAGRSFSYLYSTVTEFKKKQTDSQSLTHTEDDSLSLIKYRYWLCTQLLADIQSRDMCISSRSHGYFSIFIH